jgi:membrane fusion protein, multidrug efflux system
VRTVKTGSTIDNMTLIAEGLKPGEQVVTDGQLRLVPGSKVQQKGAGRGPGGDPGASPGQGDQGGGRKRGAGGNANQ